MTSSTIIELSRYTSEDKISPAQWKNNLKSGIMLEAGDQVLLKNCFIDTTNLSSANFIFTEDINCKISFGFYMIGTDIEQIQIIPGQYVYNGGGFSGFKRSGSAVVADGLPYFCKEFTEGSMPSNDDAPYLDYTIFTIPAGTYSKTYLAQFINRQLQGIKPVGNTGASIVLNNYEASEAEYPFPTIETVFQSLSMGFLPSNTDPTKTYYLCYAGDGATPFSNSFTEAATPVYFSKGVTNLPYGTTNGNQYIFGSTSSFQVPDPDSDAKYTNFDSGYMGCNSMSLSYNTDSQLYQWDYIHTPLVDGNNNQVTGAVYNKLGSNTIASLAFLNARTGLMLTNLEPKSFWEDTLGFNLSNICFDPKNNFNDITFDEFMQKTTMNFPSLQLFQVDAKPVDVYGTTFKSLDSIVTKRSGAWFTDSNATVPLLASNISKGTIISGGHYLIDVKGYNTNFKNQLMDTQYKGLVSAYFVSADAYVCGIGPDSSFYIHKGSPMNLNSFEVSIINPINKQPAQNLGNNSSVYLQVVKTERPPTQDQDDKN